MRIPQQHKIITSHKTLAADLTLAIKESISDIKKGDFIEFCTTKEFHKKLKDQGI